MKEKLDCQKQKRESKFDVNPLFVENSNRRELHKIAWSNRCEEQICVCNMNRENENEEETHRIKISDKT